MEIQEQNKINTPKVSGLYARVSTSRQENEQTIDSQLDEIKSKIESDGNILSSAHIFIDNGWTGSILARPALDELRDSINKQEIEILYVYDLGRLSRDFTNQLILIKEIEEAGVKLLSLHDINPENQEQGFIRNILGSFHDYERVKIADRFRRGKLYKAKNGVLINGQSLYGYNYVKKTDTTPAHYEINEEETRVVEMIFRWVGNDGISLREVIRKLYDLGISPRKRKREFWTKGPIVRLLRCRAYLDGIIYYNKSEAVVARNPVENGKYKKVKKTSRVVRPKEDWLPFNIPTILQNDGVFERVQQILSDNQKYASKNRKYNYLLTSKVFCGCGNRRVGDGYSKGSNHYYRCAERIYKFPLEGRCKIPGVNAVVMDGLFWEELKKFLADPDLLRQQAHLDTEAQLKQSMSNFSVSEKINEQLTKLKEEENRYAKAYGTSSIDFEQFQELIKEVKKKRLAYEMQLKELQDEGSIPEANHEELDELCSEAKKVLKSLDPENKSQIVREVIKQVIIKEGGEVEVCGHISLFTQYMGYEPTRRFDWIAECGEVNPF